MPPWVRSIEGGTDPTPRALLAASLGTDRSEQEVPKPHTRRDALLIGELHRDLSYGAARSAFSGILSCTAAIRCVKWRAGEEVLAVIRDGVQVVEVARPFEVSCQAVHPDACGLAL